MTISQYLTSDHERLDSLLDRLLTELPVIDEQVYLQFKAGLLMHIRWEETILLPAARAANDGEAIPVAAKLRLDHGAIAALLVPPPTPGILRALRTVLQAHNPLEESQAGAYAECDQLLTGKADEIIRHFESLTPVPMAKNTNVLRAMESARNALERAGFSRTLID